MVFFCGFIFNSYIIHIQVHVLIDIIFFTQFTTVLTIATVETTVTKSQNGIQRMTENMK